MNRDHDDTHPYCACLYYSANALARQITRVAEAEFAPTGLAPSLGFVLMTVNRQPGVQPSEVASVMMLSPSTVTRLAEKLETKGLLRREAHGKMAFLFPTPSGEALHSELLDAWRRLHAAYSGKIGEKASERLTEQAYAATLALDRT